MLQLLSSCVIASSVIVIVPFRVVPDLAITNPAGFGRTCFQITEEYA